MPNVIRYIEFVRPCHYHPAFSDDLRKHFWMLLVKLPFAYSSTDITTSWLLIKVFQS